MSWLNVSASRRRRPRWIWVCCSLCKTARACICANRTSGLLYGVMSRDYYGALQIVDNAIDGPVGRFLGQLDASVGQYGLFIDSNHTQGCRIENNRIRHYW